MGHIRQTWLLKDSVMWSKKDAKYIVESLISKKSSARTIGYTGKDSIYSSKIFESKLVPRETDFWGASPAHVWKLGWTFFQLDREDFHCRETLTYGLQRNLVDTGRKIDNRKLCVVREYFSTKYSILEEHWPKYIDAFLGMCGVSKNIRTIFAGYNSTTGYATFPASIALWRSTFLTAPSVLVALMRNSSLLIKPGGKSLRTIPEIVEEILDDKKKSWDKDNKRMYRYNAFGTNSMLWFTLLWINKLRTVCNDFNFRIDEHYADGPNNFIGTTRESIAKVLSDLDIEEKKEVYLLLGGRDKDLFHKVVGHFGIEIRNVLNEFPEVI